jgi:PAS domain S-box-containing protein
MGIADDNPGDIYLYTVVEAAGMAWTGFLSSVPSRGGEGSAPAGADVDGDTEALVTSILDGLERPTTVVDAEGRITHINRQARRLYGTDAPTAVGARPAELPDSDGGSSAIVAEALERGADVQGRTETLTVAGETTPVERTVSLLRDDADALVGAMLVETDVTERRRQRRTKRALDAYQRTVLDDLGAKLRALADGDLTVDPVVPEPDADADELVRVYERFDEMNGDLKRAVDSIRRTVEVLTDDADDLAEISTSLSASAQEVTSAIEEIDASTSELDRGADDLAAETQHASDDIDDLSAAIEEITASIERIDERSGATARLAGEGVDEVSVAVDRIRGATDATATVAERIDSLEESMGEVGDIIEVIDDIAEQTNLLALNANIEAARAGEAGDGFAVVANEVKSLASESQAAADEVATIVERVQSRTADLVTSIREATAEVDEGATAVSDVVDRLETIEETARATSEGVAEVTDAVESQAANAERISSVVDDAAGLTEEMTASIAEISNGVDEQTAAMDRVAERAEQVSHMGDDMYERVDLFKLDATEAAQLDDVSGR